MRETTRTVKALGAVQDHVQGVGGESEKLRSECGSE
jgi:hypothetical protein